MREPKLAHILVYVIYDSQYRHFSIVERYRWKIIKYPVFNVFLLKNKIREILLTLRAETLFLDFDSDFWCTAKCDHVHEVQIL